MQLSAPTISWSPSPSSSRLEHCKKAGRVSYSMQRTRVVTATRSPGGSPQRGLRREVCLHLGESTSAPARAERFKSSEQNEGRARVERRVAFIEVADLLVCSVIERFQI